MYQPALGPDQIRSLYLLKIEQSRPMRSLVREAVDPYLRRHGAGLVEEKMTPCNLSPQAASDPLD